MNTFEDLVEKAMFNLRFKAPVELVEAQLEYSFHEFIKASSCMRSYLTCTFGGAQYIVPDFLNPNSAADPDAVLIPAHGSQQVPFHTLNILNIHHNGVQIPNKHYTYHRVKQIVESEFLIGKEVMISYSFMLNNISEAPAHFLFNYGDFIVSHACFELASSEIEPWALSQTRLSVLMQNYLAGVRSAKNSNYKKLSMRPK